VHNKLNCILKERIDSHLPKPVVNNSSFTGYVTT